MLDFTNKNALKATDNIAALSSLSTYYFHINPTQVSSVTESTLFFAAGSTYFKIYIANSKLYVFHEGRFDDGIWTCPISTGNQQIALTYNATANNTTAPVIYINGTKQTVTEDTPPDDTNSVGSSPIFIGGTNNKASTNSFQGYMGEMAIFIGTGLTNVQLEQLSNSRKMGLPLQYSSLTHYFAMDEAGDGAKLNETATILPTSNIAFTWATGSGYTDIDADDANSITATKNDDGELVEFGMGTTSVSGDIVAVDVETKSNPDDTGVQCSVSVYMNGAYQTYQGIGNTSATTQTQNHIFLPALGENWTQSDVDAAQLAIQANASIGKDEETTIYYVPIYIYYGKFIRDRKGTMRLAGHDTGTTENCPIGKANNYLSY